VSDATRVRLVARVGEVAGERLATHTTGFPLDPAKMLPMPDVVLLETGNGPGAMLFRYTARGESGGDTWHESVGDAKAQAAYEYRAALGPWAEVPRDVADAHTYAVRYAATVGEA
jgi:hypothetical protein